MAKKPENTNYKVVAENRRARFDFAIEEDLEVGIVLHGSEVKSLRIGQSNIAESYASVDDGELWLTNGYIAPYDRAMFSHEERRKRKLLCSRRELLGTFQRVKSAAQQPPFSIAIEHCRGPCWRRWRRYAARRVARRRRGCGR